MSTSTVDWLEAGRGWGARATEWAYLWEPYALPANEVLFDGLGVRTGDRLLDIACGSGFAASVASRRGAEVSGIDASEELAAIAAARTPGGSFRAGNMFALPSRITASISSPVSTGFGRGARALSKRRSECWSPRAVWA